MTAEKATPGHPQAGAGWTRTLNLVNPLRAVWWLFTNVRFAIFLLGLLAAVSMIGVLVPQMTSNVRGDAVAEEEWLDIREDTFGFLTDPMDTMGLFDVFHERWFALLLGVTVASTGAYIVSRLPGALHNIARPRTRVPDRYFDLSPHSLRLSSRIEPSSLERELRARRYKVRINVEEGATHIFADRLQWAALGTFLTHAAVIVFVLAAIVSRVDAFSSPLFLAEGTNLPLFAVSDPNQVQVELVDARAEFAPDGQPLDYQADLIIYDRGEEVLRCTSTVNSPCGYKGYRFHQAAYFGYGAEVQVRGVDSGNLLFGETLALSQRLPSPHLRITAADGEVLLEETVLLTEAARAGDTEYRAALVRAANGEPVTLWQSTEGGDLLVFEPSDSGDGIQGSLSVGETVSNGDASITYVRTDDVPSTIAEDVPLPESIGGGSGEVLLLLQNVVYGIEDTSAGDDMASLTDEEPKLTIVGLSLQPKILYAGESVAIGGFEYKFSGQREFSGIEVKRDRSDNLVWIGAAAIVIGLMITFWVPRRRLWAKIDEGRLSMAGQAPWHARFKDEMREIAEAAGVNSRENRQAT